MVAPHEFPSIDERKRGLRRVMRERRAVSDGVLPERVLACVLEAGIEPVAAVWPLPGEPDLRGVCRALDEAGVGVCLPQTPSRGHPLVFRRWGPGVPMVRGRFGTVHPEGEVVVPVLVLVPFLAFDRRGFRLGYGGGYYDRTLAGLPGVASLGFGYACQEVTEVPVDRYDRPLDRIVTEREVICCSVS